MEDLGIGQGLRAVRLRHGWTQAQLASAAAVSTSCVSRMERGHFAALSIRTMRRIAASLDVRLDVVARWRGGELDRLRDRAHALLVQRIVVALIEDGWEVAPEVSFSVFGERGSIDVLAWHPERRILLVVEAKASLTDMQNLLTTIDRKRRLAPQIAAERGWSDATAVATWVAIADTRTNRRRLASFATLLRAAFPVEGRAFRAWRRRPSGAVAALTFMTDLHPGNARRDRAD